MKIATWNLERPRRSNGRRRARITEFISRVDADVWLLTETHESVTPGDGYECVSTAGADRPGEAGEHWVTIWSRFPITPVRTAADPIRAVAARVVPPRGTPLIVYGSVLPWLGSGWRGFAAEKGCAFAAALYEQASDWQELRMAHPDHDLIVGGDYNQDLSRHHFYGSAANRKRLLAALDRSGLHALTGGDADPVRRSSPEWASIDHICLPASASWRLVSIRHFPEVPVPDQRLSDHFGIVVELEPATITAPQRRFLQ